MEPEPNGAFNVTEFGTVTEPEQFKALYAYSPCRLRSSEFGLRVFGFRSDFGLRNSAI